MFFNEFLEPTKIGLKILFPFQIQKNLKSRFKYIFILHKIRKLRTLQIKLSNQNSLLLRFVEMFEKI